MTELIRYDAMCRAIADTYELDEVKEIRDRAIALEAYARQARNLEAEERCKEIRHRAEAKWGRLYSASEKAKGAQGNPGGQGAAIVKSGETTPQTLSDMGVTRDQSSRWQKLGAVSEPEFEAAIAERRVEQLITKPDDSALAVNADVLWLWGRLRDFRERGLLEMTPDDLAATATDQMKEEIGGLAPAVAAWLLKWTSNYV